MVCQASAGQKYTVHPAMAVRSVYILLCPPWLSNKEERRAVIEITFDRLLKCREWDKLRD